MHENDAQRLAASWQADSRSPDSERERFALALQKHVPNEYAAAAVIEGSGIGALARKNVSFTVEQLPNDPEAIVCSTVVLSPDNACLRATQHHEPQIIRTRWEVVSERPPTTIAVKGLAHDDWTDRSWA